MNKLMSFFSDGTGMYSIYRLCFFLWCSLLSIIWAILCVKKQELLPINSSLLYMTGIFVSGKVTQSLVEAIPSQASSTIKTTTQTVQPAPQTIVTTEKTVIAPNNP